MEDLRTQPRSARMRIGGFTTRLAGYNGVVTDWAGFPDERAKRDRAKRDRAKRDRAK
jgi:hypothetical protein